MDQTNRERSWRFLLGVLKAQSADPLCGSCNGYVKVRAALRDALLEQQAASCLAELDALPLPPAPVSQKKAGACGLPEGQCFVKTSFALAQAVP